jgi:hypothetical protein
VTRHSVPVGAARGSAHRLIPLLAALVPLLVHPLVHPGVAGLEAAPPSGSLGVIHPALQVPPEPDTLRPPGDTLPDVAPEADTLDFATDTVLTDAARQVPPRNLPLVPGGTPPRPEAGVWVWDRSELLGTEALTLHDLLTLVPGLIPLRGGDYGTPVAVTTAGFGPGQVRLFLDGIEDPAQGGRGGGPEPGGARGSGRGAGRAPSRRAPHPSHDPPAHRRRPYTHLDVGTGDLRTNLFRATFAHPSILGGTFLVASIGWTPRATARTTREPPSGPDSGTRTSRGTEAASPWTTGPNRAPARWGSTPPGGEPLRLDGAGALAPLGRPGGRAFTGHEPRGGRRGGSLPPPTPSFPWAPGERRGSVGRRSVGPGGSGPAPASDQARDGLRRSWRWKEGRIGTGSEGSPLHGTGRDGGTGRAAIPSPPGPGRSPDSGDLPLRRCPGSPAGIPFLVPRPLPPDEEKGRRTATPGRPRTTRNPSRRPPSASPSVRDSGSGARAEWRGVDLIRRLPPHRGGFPGPHGPSLRPERLHHARGSPERGGAGGTPPPGPGPGGTPPPGACPVLGSRCSWRYLPDRSWLGALSWRHQGYGSNLEIWTDVGARGRDSMLTPHPGRRDRRLLRGPLPPRAGSPACRSG